jgi:membrane carboxypeptidase/penicillin-binding protein
MDDDNPSILLGAVGIPPIQMAEAYSTIARQGARLAPRAIRFVTDDRGRSIAGNEAPKPVQVLPQRDVYVLTNVMKGVVDRGTAGSARSMGFRKIAAGKTGTTNDKRDAWFIGFTPQTLTLTWVGFDDNDPTGLSGSDAAVPMWTRYMLAVASNAQNLDFAAPEGIVLADVDAITGGVATEYCPRNQVVRMAFKSGTEPAAPCAEHQASSTVVPMYDELGNPILTNTAAPPMTDTATAPPPVAPDSTLTGGIFKTDTTSTTSTVSTTSTTATEPAPPATTETTGTTPPSTTTSPP